MASRGSCSLAGGGASPASPACSTTADVAKHSSGGRRSDPQEQKPGADERRAISLLDPREGEAGSIRVCVCRVGKNGDGS